MESKVSESAKFVAGHSQHVRVNETACITMGRKLAGNMKSTSYTAQAWSKHPLNPKEKTAHTANWIFLVDALNFSFWSDSSEHERYTVEYKGQKYTGYWSLVASINRALDEQIDLTSPAFWRSEHFTLDLLRYIFRSQTEEEIPLLVQRFELLRETGFAFENEGWQSAVDMIESAHGSSQALLQILMEKVPGFKDVSTYSGREVYILKRAQILIGDLWAAFDGKSHGWFHDIDKITMFADYRVPQLLQVLGCLSYSDELLTTIKSGLLISNGDPMEVELRCCSIWAVQLMVQSAKDINPIVNAVLLDFFLWDAAKEAEFQQELPLPVHRTRSIYY